MSIPKLHKQRTSRLDNRETPDTIQSAKQERSRRSIALYNNRIFTEEKNNIRVQFLLTSAPLKKNASSGYLNIITTAKGIVKSGPSDDKKIPYEIIPTS